VLVASSLILGYDATASSNHKVVGATSSNIYPKKVPKVYFIFGRPFRYHACTSYL